MKRADDRSIASRLVPAPWLSAALLALWLLLSQSIGVGAVLLGALFALVIPFAVAPLRPVPKRLRAPRIALKLLGAVLADLVTSNVSVARGIVRRVPPRASFIEVPLELRDPSGLAVLAVIMCLTPDTLWAELSIDRTRLSIHVFDLEDEAAYVAEVKARYEQPLMEIFQ